MNKFLPAAIVATLFAGAAFAQTAAEGEKVFKKCSGCHQAGPKAKNRVGPVLSGVVGRAAGSYEGYKYSKSMIAAGQAGLVWGPDTIFNYLADPTKFLRAFLDDPKAKAKMKFKLKKEGDRQAVIAYLATFETASASASNFCIVNASEESLFFAAETREGDRSVATLKPGEKLCSLTTASLDGVVSVYESEDGFEGCSRVIPVGKSEEMLEFAQFDRCGWTSNQS